MISELISFPLRLGVRAARLTLQTTEQALQVAGLVAEQVIQRVRPPEPEPEPPETRAAPESSVKPAAPSIPPRRPAVRAAPAPPSPAPVSEPGHVSSEPTLVEELAEPGAEDGAGAEIRVDEPWPEYQRMGAKDVVARLAEASPAELAAVQLYERTHRARQTVLTAAERRLRAANGSGSPIETRGRQTNG